MAPATYIVISTVILSVIALISVGLRFLARIKQGAALAQDDYLLLAGLVFALGLSLCTVLAVYLGHLGEHVVTDSEGLPQYDDWLYRFWEIEWLGQLISVVGFTLIKASLVLLYRRIFRGDRFKLVNTILLVIVYGWGVSFFLAVLLQCKPVSQALLPPQERTGNCYNPAPVVEGMAVTNLIIDISILVTPQPVVWKLHMPLKQRVALSFIFLLGFFVVAIGAVRVYYYFLSNTDVEHKLFDIAWHHAPAFYWTNFDECVAIVCASLPTLNPLFAGLSPRAFIRNIASKVQMRSSPRQSWNNLPEWEGHWGEGGTSSGYGLNRASPSAIHMSSLGATNEHHNSVTSSAV